MSDKPLHVQCSPLTGAIYAGHVNTKKDGFSTWAANKTDVTAEALFAVAEHAMKFGEPVILSQGEEGTREAMYEITVKDLRGRDGG